MAAGPRRSRTSFGMSAVTIDVVAERPDGSFCLYLVEEGPWPTDHSQHLRALQKRLFDVIEVIAEGKLAERFPASKGRRMCVRLDCYDLPATPVDALFAAFQEFCKSSPEWSGACQSLVFEISHGSLREANPEGCIAGSAPGRGLQMANKAGGRAEPANTPPVEQAAV